MQALRTINNKKTGKIDRPERDRKFFVLFFKWRERKTVLYTLSYRYRGDVLIFSGKSTFEKKKKKLTENLFRKLSWNPVEISSSSNIFIFFCRPLQIIVFKQTEKNQTLQKKKTLFFLCFSKSSLSTRYLPLLTSFILVFYAANLSAFLPIGTNTLSIYKLFNTIFSTKFLFTFCFYFVSCVNWLWNLNFSGGTTTLTKLYPSAVSMRLSSHSASLICYQWYDRGASASNKWFVYQLIVYRGGDIDIEW